MAISEEIIDALFDYIKANTENWRVYSDYMIMKYVAPFLKYRNYDAIKIRLSSKKERNYKIEFPVESFVISEVYCLNKPTLPKKFLAIFSSSCKREIQQWKFIDSLYRSIQIEYIKGKRTKDLETIKMYSKGEINDREESN